MRIPLYPITTDDGVPFPETGATLDIPLERFQNFNTKTVVDPQTGEEIEAIVFAFISNDVETSRLYSDPEYLVEHTARLGIYCNVVEVAETDDFCYITVEAICRCHLKKSAIDGELGLAVEFDPVADDFRLEPPHTLDQIDRLISDALEQEILDKTAATKLAAATSAQTKFNIFANEIIKDPFYRFKFLQRLGLLDRLGIVTRSYKTFKSETIRDKITKNIRRRPRKGRMKVGHSFSPDELRRRISKLELSEEAKFSVQRELNRLETLKKESSDYATTVDYLNWIASIPWNDTCHSDIDLHRLITLLDESHYGLGEVKQEVLEHLALQDHLGQSKGMVLCFVGPAGVGKTTIGQEIAKATNRPFHQISLGGISEESEIRGHRRTYVGSRPGRLIVGARDVGVRDPLFLLDEIDKMQARSGDPASALLEVLDPKQNHAFVDKYLEIPFDFSKAMFICTANDINAIPGPLKDRMDIIKFRAYTEKERQVILRDFMLPKAISDFEMTEWDLEWDDQWLTELAKKETQLRQIDLRIRKVLRKRILDEKLGNAAENLLSGGDATKRSATRRPVGFGQ